MPKQILDSYNDIRDQAQQPLDSTSSIHCLATYYKVGTVQVYKQSQLDIIVMPEPWRWRWSTSLEWLCAGTTWCSSGPEKILLNLRILKEVKPLLLPPYKFMCLTRFYYWVQVINYYGIWASSNGIMFKQSPQKWVSSMKGETSDTHIHTHTYTHTHTHHMAWWSQQPAWYLLGTKVQHKKCVQNASQ
jgi:hypothetical protein